MARVYLSIGSNIDRYLHISSALDALQVLAGELLISPVYESEAVGFEGDHFLNLVVGLDTELSLIDLAHHLREIEDDNLRNRGGPKFGSRTLDIDILTYDDFVGKKGGISLPRAEILHNAFVLRPLADLAGEELHPECQRSYGELWQDYDQSSQKLWPVAFTWSGREISSAEG